MKRPHSASIEPRGTTIRSSVRMQEAAHLLRTTDESLGAIAERVGYRSEFAFNRAFHRALGTPPGAYRKEHGR